MMLFNKFKLIVLGGLMISCLSLRGQTFRGCGAFINSQGDILTCARVIDDNPGSLIVADFDGKQYPATLKKIDKTKDLAVISINQEIKYCAYLRMDAKTEHPVKPVSLEIINVIGYQERTFDPRGALIEEVEGPGISEGHFRIGLGSAYDCSGALILDDNGLLIGMIAHGTKETDENLLLINYVPPRIYGIDASLILSFLNDAGIVVAVSNKSDPFNLKGFDQMKRINEVINIGASFVVEILSKNQCLLTSEKR